MDLISYLLAGSKLLLLNILHNNYADNQLKMYGTKANAIVTSVKYMSDNKSYPGIISAGINKPIEFMIHPETTSYAILLDFSKNKLAGPAQFNPQNPYPYVYLAKDFTKEFQVIDPDLERVELSQGMFTYPYFLPMKFADGILK